MNIREKTCIIIKKNGHFLVGRSMLTRALNWSTSPWDAWHTRRRDKAFIIADKVGGQRMLFNPIAGQLRELIVND